MMFIQVAKIRLTQKFISQLIIMQNNTNVMYFSQTLVLQREKPKYLHYFCLEISDINLVFYPSILRFS